MGASGEIVSGAFDVLIGGQQAARKSDLTDHAGMIVDGEETVVIGGTALVAARVADRFSCPDWTLLPHVGGVILPPGCPTVLIGGRPAARMGDLAGCGAPIIAGCPTVLIGG